MESAYVILIFIGFVGFLVSYYIHHKKKTKEKLVCPVGAKCSSVIHSDFSRFFGIPVEVIGMTYYSLVAVFYGLLTLVPNIATLSVLFVMFSITLSAFLFSIYLTFIQAFAIKQWCSWCLFSAFLCTIIFLFVVAGLPQGIIAFLQVTGGVIETIHALALAVGVGGATISTVFFLKFLKSLRISHFEADVLRMLGDIVWGAIGVLVVAGTGFYLPDVAQGIISDKMLLEIAAIAIIIADSAFLHFFVSPRLKRISFGEEHTHIKGELGKLHESTFALGSISLVSWYFLFVVLIAPELTLGFLPLLGIYFLFLVLATVISQLAEAYFHNQRSSQL